MLNSRVLLGCLILVFAFGVGIAQDDPNNAIDQGWNLYYQANFAGATAILEKVDRELDTASGKQEDRIRAKLGLALCYVGQNRIPRAEEKFVEILLLDSSYDLDANQHPPKVIAAFNNAKPRAQERMCANMCAQGQQLVALGDSGALKELIKTSGAACPCLNNFTKELGRILVENGKQAYATEKYSLALRNLQEALQLDPENQDGKTYLQFSQQQVKIARQSIHLEWKSAFMDGKYDAAFAAFEKLRQLEDDEAMLLITQIEQDYQKLLNELVAAWKDACSKHDQPRMQEIAAKASAVDPGQILNRTHLDQIKSCDQPPPPPPPTPPPRAEVIPSCLKISPIAYLQKVIKRIEPEYPPAARKAGIKGTVRMQIRVDTEGKVSEIEILQGHALLAQAAREAVRRWEFRPTILSGQAVCVITEIGVDFK